MDVMYAQMGRDVMPMQQAAIDRGADPSGPFRRGVDQLMRIGVRDLAKKQTKPDIDQYLVRRTQNGVFRQRPNAKR